MNLLYKNKYKNKYKKIIISLDKKEKRTYVLGVKNLKSAGVGSFVPETFQSFPHFLLFYA